MVPRITPPRVAKEACMTPNRSTVRNATGAIRMEGAKWVAERLLRWCPSILAVELFGSVSRDAVGNDLDLVIVTDEHRFRQFLALVHGAGQETRYEYHVSRAERRSIARYVLGELDEIMPALGSRIPENLLDLYVFPPDWKCRIGEIQHVLPADDPSFVRNIAMDARLLAAR
jgi:predicted nucleotidyltransferase